MSITKNPWRRITVLENRDSKWIKFIEEANPLMTLVNQAKSLHLNQKIAPLLQKLILLIYCRLNHQKMDMCKIISKKWENQSKLLMKGKGFSRKAKRIASN